jgi:hypothetical protein
MEYLWSIYGVSSEEGRRISLFPLKFKSFIIGGERQEKETKIPIPSRIHKELLEGVGDFYSVSLLKYLFSI